MSKIKWINVTAHFAFLFEDLEKAIKWGRKHKYTYERDKEFDAFLVNAVLSGVIDPYVKETELK